jgi:hypothetical protein
MWSVMSRAASKQRSIGAVITVSMRIFTMEVRPLPASCVE